ncbi:MAG: tRNA (adenosine(37)-N6)-threonylcarbamoyltransferase complex ATPase subunit type 1 TsaE [Candidatus Sumerlaeia bacterium]
MTSPLWQFLSPSEDATVDLGRRIGAACRGGEVILLDGPLGAGKTCFAGGLAAGLGIDEPAVSPTFVILRSYRGDRGLTLHHFDFYRLGGEGDLDTIGFEDCLTDDAVVLIEWPERCPSLFEQFTLALKLEVIDEASRRITAWPGLLAHEHLVEK